MFYVILHVCVCHFSFDGRVVAKLPFVPLSYIQGLSHRNLLGEDYTDCSFIFLYILCTMSIRQVRSIWCFCITSILFKLKMSKLNVAVHLSTYIVIVTKSWGFKYLHLIKICIFKYWKVNSKSLHKVINSYTRRYFDLPFDNWLSTQILKPYCCSYALINSHSNIKSCLATHLSCIFVVKTHFCFTV